MEKPIPYSIGTGRFLSEKTLKALKVDTTLAGLPLIDYTDFDKVIEKYCLSKTDTAESAFKTLTKIFKEVSKHDQSLAVRKYTGAVQDYYHKEKQTFLRMYSRKLELLSLQEQIEHEGNVAGAEAVLNGVRNTKRKLRERRVQSDPAPSPLTLHIPRRNLESPIPEQTATSSQSGPSDSSTASPSPALNIKKQSNSRYPNLMTPTAINITEMKEILKQEATSKHTLFSKGIKLDPHSFKRMSVGLSSIINFADTSQYSQKRFLTEKTWNYLENHFGYIYQVQKYVLTDLLKSTWKVIAISCQKTNSTYKAKEYLKKVLDAETRKNGHDSESVKILKIFDFILDMYLENEWLFDEKQKKTECDFITIIWSPLLRKMANIHNNMILVKGGDSVNPFTQFMRKILYEEEKKVMGLKIDLRFVIPDKENDIDVGALEAANELSSENKITYDAAKILTEAKDILDSNINNTINIGDIRYLSGTGFQVGGLAAETISVHLFAPHVYIGVPRYSFQIPANIQSLNGFDVTFEQIMTHIIEMEHQATYIKTSREFFESCRRSFGNHSPAHDDNHTDYVTWTSPSWYPPVNKKSRRSKVPDDNDVPLSTPSLSSSSSKNAVGYDPELVDEYGWVSVDGRYYHIEADTYLENHPFNQEVEGSDNN